MSDFKLTNFKQLEDSAGRRGPGIEARFARQSLESEHLGISYFRYAPGYRSPIGHRHREQEEAYVILSGSGRAKLDDQIVELQQWDVLRVAPRVARSFEGGPDGIELIAIGSDRPEGGDGELIPDHWSED
jgi:mannose-6-phosphate isomerase-like protein (cupin superfamily)